jgi:hypothetical protein
MKRVLGVLLVALLVIGVGVIGAQEDTATYEGEGFSFVYPAGWAEVALEDAVDGAVSLGPSPDAVIENGIASDLVVTVTFGEDIATIIGAEQDMVFTVDPGTDPDTLTGYFGGVLYFVDVFAGGFGGSEGSAEVSVVLVGEDTAFILEGLAIDVLLVAQATDDGVVLVLAQAPAGTLADWRDDVEALVESVALD